MSRFATYNHLRAKTEEETTKGGNPQNAIAFAILALAEAIVATENDELKIEITSPIELHPVEVIQK